MRILLAEDDPLLGDGLRAALEKAGFSVLWAKDGGTALGLLESEGCDALVLDIGLPVVDGLEVLRQLRAGGSRLPVLVLTARDATRDKVLALDHGADDYLVKTAEMAELIARIRALLRRSSFGGSGSLVLGGLTLDLASHTVTIEDRAVPISMRESAVLRALIEGAGRVLTRRQLAEALYGEGKEIDSNALEVHIHNLRHKLGSNLIKTVRGIGYTIARPSP